MSSDEISWVVTCSVEPAQFDEFRRVVGPLVAETLEEPGALAYEYYVDTGRSTVHILERYRDSNAVVSHVTGTFAKFAERFLALVKVTGFVVYGTPEAEAKQILDGFPATYMTRFDGFGREVKTPA